MNGQPWESRSNVMHAPEGRSNHPLPSSFIMSHTYCCSLLHCVFSTKDRRKSLTTDIQPHLWSYMGGIARNHQMRALIVGESDDHVHLLLSIPSTITISGAMRIMKSESSRWMHDARGQQSFEWQEGYGAFSIGHSQVQSTLAYIANQQEHHRKRDFQEEFITFLKKNEIEYDPRYVLG